MDIWGIGATVIVAVAIFFIQDWRNKKAIHRQQEDFAKSLRKQQENLNQGLQRFREEFPAILVRNREKETGQPVPPAAMAEFKATAGTAATILSEYMGPKGSTPLWVFQSGTARIASRKPPQAMPGVPIIYVDEDEQRQKEDTKPKWSGEP